MAEIVCQRKLAKLIDKAPEGVITSSLPVLLTGSGIGRIACTCNHGIKLDELPSSREELGEPPLACEEPEPEPEEEDVPEAGYTDEAADVAATAMACGSNL